MSDEKQLARAVLQSGLTSLCGEQKLDAVLKSDHTVNIPDSIPAFLVLTGH